MAETITDPGLLTQAVMSTKTALGLGAHRFVVISGNVDPDAAPSDTTLYTVPAGRTFFLVRAQTARQDNASTLPLYDSAGDSATGDVILTTVSANKEYGMVQHDYLQPVEFRKGITVDSGDLGGEKDVRYIFQGYLV